MHDNITKGSPFDEVLLTFPKTEDENAFRKALFYAFRDKIKPETDANTQRPEITEVDIEERLRKITKNFKEHNNKRHLGFPRNVGWISEENVSNKAIQALARFAHKSSHEIYALRWEVNLFICIFNLSSNTNIESKGLTPYFNPNKQYPNERTPKSREKLGTDNRKLFIKSMHNLAIERVPYYKEKLRILPAILEEFFGKLPLSMSHIQDDLVKILQGENECAECKTLNTISLLLTGTRLIDNTSWNLTDSTIETREEAPTSSTTPHTDPSEKNESSHFPLMLTEHTIRWEPVWIRQTSTRYKTLSAQHGLSSKNIYTGGDKDIQSTMLKICDRHIRSYPLVIKETLLTLSNGRSILSKTSRHFRSAISFLIVAIIDLFETETLLRNVTMLVNIQDPFSLADLVKSTLIAKLMKIGKVHILTHQNTTQNAEFPSQNKVDEIFKKSAIDFFHLSCKFSDRLEVRITNQEIKEVAFIDPDTTSTLMYYAPCLESEITDEMEGEGSFAHEVFNESLRLWKDASPLREYVLKECSYSSPVPAYDMPLRNLMCNQGPDRS